MDELMACRTCDHTMQAISSRTFWCPRCGTLKCLDDPNPENGIPVLIPRIKRFQESLKEQEYLALLTELRTTGIYESITNG